jgi:hypothetical protein
MAMNGTLVGPFAAAHESILVSDLDDSCVRLFMWLELRTGGQDDWDRSVTQTGHELGWQSRRVLAHAKHLAERRIITLSEPSRRASPRMRIRYQPARGDVDSTVILHPPKPLAQPRRPTIREREHTRPSRMLNENYGESTSGWDGERGHTRASRVLGEMDGDSFSDEACATVAHALRDDRVCPQTEAYATFAGAPVSALEEGYGLTRVSKENGHAESSDFEQVSADDELLEIRDFTVDDAELAAFEAVDAGLEHLDEPDEDVDATVRGIELLRHAFGDDIEVVS